MEERSHGIIPQSDGRGKHPIADYTGISVQTIFRLERRGQFPRRIQVSQGRVGWLKTEVDQWLANRPRGPLMSPSRKAWEARNTPVQ